MFKVPVAIIVGDSLGHDKIVGQYTYDQNVEKLCHCCSCSYQQADKPMFWFTYTKQRHVQWLINNNDTDSLAAISHHNVCNAFHRVCFGGDSCGVHGATLFEILHANQIGIVKYAKNYFFMECLSECNCVKVDALAYKLSECCKHQSDRNLPRTSFPYGISSMTKITGMEQSGIILLLILLLATHDGQHLLDNCQKMGSKKCKQFIKLFEKLLIWETWLSNEDGYKHKELKTVQTKVQDFLKFYKKVVK
jgi:hypothetical protein